MSEIDPVKLTADLIKCPSVTPDEGGAIALIELYIICFQDFVILSKS